MIFLICICVASVAVNILLIWYIRKMLTKLLYVSDNIGDMLDKVEGFGSHLESVHEMEMFYGEPILTNLIGHSKAIAEEIKTYKDIYELTREIEEEAAEERVVYGRTKEG